MKTNGVASYLWRALLSIQGVVITAAGFSLAFVAWIWKSETEVRFSALQIAIATFIFTLITTTLAKALTDASSATHHQIPKAILCRTITTPNALLTIILLAPSELFSEGMAVSFYHVDKDGFEQQIGLGYIHVVQDDRRIQAALIDYHTSQADLITQLHQNNNQALGNLRVKPYLHHSLIPIPDRSRTNA